MKRPRDVGGRATTTDYLVKCADTQAAGIGAGCSNWPDLQHTQADTLTLQTTKKVDEGRRTQEERQSVSARSQLRAVEDSCALVGQYAVKSLETANAQLVTCRRRPSDRSSRSQLTPFEAPRWQVEAVTNYNDALLLHRGKQEHPQRTLNSPKP